jgi:fatty-acid desaturase
MAVALQQVASPDGRTWTVTVERTRRRLKDTCDEPFFWAHVVVTAILVALMIWLFRHDWSGIWAVLIPAMVLIWAIGFVASATGSQIRAATPGPPDWR